MRPTLSLETLSLSGLSVERDCNLTVVLNPFARSEKEGIALNDLLHDDPTTGNAILDRLVAETRSDIAQSGSKGILYVLEGARAGCCSPMQYGGYYLERDRELLGEIQSEAPTVLAVIGGEDVFLDFVSDLPAEIFAWDAKASSFDSAYVRGIREGIQASSDPGSEIELIGSLEKIPEMRKLSEAHV
jgi:hypothetical protein